MDTKPKLELLANVTQTDEQLKGCDTVESLFKCRRDIGAVLIGGNPVGRKYAVSASCDRTQTMVCMDACHVAMCCVMSPSMDANVQESILVSHSATIGELKQKVLQQMTDAFSSQRAIRAGGTADFVCRNVDGVIQNDAQKLSDMQTSATACAEVEYHSMFFFHFKPPSMQKAHVQELIHVLPSRRSAIENFVQAPIDLCLPIRDRQPASEAPECYVVVHADIMERLAKRKWNVPVPLSASEVQIINAEFSALPCNNSLRQKYLSYTKALIDGIENRSIDALELGFPKLMASHLGWLSSRWCTHPGPHPHPHPGVPHG